MHHVTSEFSEAQTIRIQPVTGGADEALLFLKLLGKDPAATRFRFFPHKENPRKAAIGPRKELGFNAERIAGHQAAGCGAYVVIGDGGDDDASITSVPALFVEWDDKPLEWQRTAWRERGLPEPSLQVETGGKSLHTYWVLDQALPPDQWREVIKRLIAHCGSDPSVKNPSRVMRLPGCGYIGADGTPTGQVRIASAVGTRYTLEQVLANVPELPEQPKRKASRRTSRTTSQKRSASRTTSQAGSRSLQEIREALAYIPPRAGAGSGTYETYRNILWGLIKAVEEAGGTEADAIDLMEAHSPDGWDVPQVARSGGDEIAAGTFWHHAREAGWVPLSALPERRKADRIAPAGEDVGVSCPIPSPQEARLVALQSGIATGKTNAIVAALNRYRAEDAEQHPRSPRRAIAPTHRRSLGRMQAERLGLVWCESGDGELSEEDSERLLRHGMVLCTDSLVPTSGMRFDASAWRGAVVVIDEVEQVLRHTLMSNGTTVAKRRMQVLRQLQELLKHAAQVIVADAHLSEPVLQALEAMVGCRALVIDSDHKAAAGREGMAYTAVGGWRVELEEHLKRRDGLWVCTTAQKPEAPQSAQNLAELIHQHLPGEPVLVVDSDTRRDPNHDASRLDSDPNGVLSRYRYVVASPAITAGLSVEGLPGHFAAVFGYSGGATDVDGLVQALGRVRDDCPRHVYAAEASPGGLMRVGSGSGDPQKLLERLSDHEARCVAQLVALGWEKGTSSVGPWLKLWAEFGALQNRQRLAYRDAALGLLKAEGYAIRRCSTTDKARAKQIGEALKEIAAERSRQEDSELAATPLINDADGADLQRARRQLSRQEQRLLERWQVAKRWALGDAVPTPEVLQANRDRLHRRLAWGWLLLNQEGRSAVVVDDEREAMRAWGGNYWAPDLCRDLKGPRLAMADRLGLPAWLQRAATGEWFTADDPALLALHQAVAQSGGAVAQVLGVEAAQRPITELENLLATAGYRLERKRRRCGKGKTATPTRYYRVVRMAAPAGASLEAMEAQWLAEARARLQSVYGTSPFGDYRSWRKEGCTEKRPIESTQIPVHRDRPGVGGEHLAVAT